MPIGNPTNVKVKIDSDSAVVTWTPPADSAGLTGYIITGVSSNGGTTRTLTITGASLKTVTGTVTALTTGKKYTFSVVSVASGVQSSPSAKTEVVKTQSITHVSTIQAKEVSGGDQMNFVKGVTTVNFHNQFVAPAPTVFTRFASAADYLAFKKASFNIGATV
uniref:Fibronectin type-III domain-containing protein n=1 Tax=viral metagenome TaxID=1070528 RepID=A0A6C0BJ56_9ZZZZ